MTALILSVVITAGVARAADLTREYEEKLRVANDAGDRALLMRKESGPVSDSSNPFNFSNGNNGSEDV